MVSRATQAQPPCGAKPHCNEQCQTQEPLVKQHMQRHVLGMPGQVTAVAGDEPVRELTLEVSIGQHRCTRAVTKLEIVDLDLSTRVVNTD